MYSHQTHYNALGAPNERAVGGESAREDLSLMRQLLVCMESADTKIAVLSLNVGKRHHYQPLIIHLVVRCDNLTSQVQVSTVGSCKHLKVAVLQMRTFQSQPGLGQ